MPESSLQQSPQGLAEPFDRILRNFGTSAPQISTVVAIVLGSLQFEEFFNAGAWTVVAILMFSLVYLYRRQVPRRLSRATLYIVMFVVIATVPPLMLARNFRTLNEFAGWLHLHQIIGTAYASCVISLSLALLLTSYQHQERVSGWAFPPALEKSVDVQITGSKFFKSNVYFEMTPVELLPGFVVIDLLMDYKVTNRTDEQRDWGMHFRLSDPEGKFLEASFNGRDIDTGSPDYRIGRGVRVPCTLGSKKVGRVRFKVRQKYRLKDSEMLTSYTPATDMKLVLVESLPGFSFDVETLYYRKAQIERVGNRRIIALTEGILPFQGVRLNWEVSHAKV